jgi:[ribosomal protein S18]-alanine N-acetyltransferase
LNIVKYTGRNSLHYNDIDAIIDFLYRHLEQFRDSKEDIRKAIGYAFSQESGKGGFVLVGYKQNKIIGVVVMNNTGMQGYIPENILVYIAIHNKERGKGYGTGLMKRAIEEAKGDIALHVEHNNPALELYLKLGFTNKYLEMRLKNS